MTGKRYSVLATAEVDIEIVVTAYSPVQAVELAALAHISKWRQLGSFGLKPAGEGIDSVTERRKDGKGKAYSVTFDDAGNPHMHDIDEDEMPF